jgi:hypothetical protein
MLAAWLRMNPQNRLTVFTGALSEEHAFHSWGRSNFGGLWHYYFASTWNQPFAGQVQVCDYSNVDHELILIGLSWYVRYPLAGCPSPSGLPAPVSWHPWMRSSGKVISIAASLCCVVLLAPVAPVTARIRPSHGIAGVGIGASAAHVRAVLGRPHRVIAPAWGYGAPLNGRVGFDHRHRVGYVWSANRSQRTRKGIGPGSSFRAMRRAYPQIPCRRTRNATRRLCTLNFHEGRRRVRCDLLFHGRLRRVDVYLVPDPVRPGPQ